MGLLETHRVTGRTIVMTSFEELFNSSVLQVFAPGSALEFPESIFNDGDKTKDWLSRLYAESTDRKVAFFGEVHHSNHETAFMIDPGLLQMRSSTSY